MIDRVVIGGDGLIGGAIVQEIALSGAPVVATSRRYSQGNIQFLDLREPRLSCALSNCRVAFLCAGINGFAECEGNRESWRVNVDGVIQVFKQLSNLTFCIYISSGAVEWSDSAYARQRAAVEAALRMSDRVAIVRPEKVTPSTVSSLAAEVVDIGNQGIAGLYRWPRPK